MMLDLALVGNALSAAFIAAIYGILVYARRRVRDGEDFKPAKLAATVVVAAVVGAAMSVNGSPFTLLTIQDRLAAYAGVVVLVEQIAKLLLDTLDAKGRGDTS